MVEYLKAKKHKGLSEIKLSQLGHINVLCGKNNSGKTTILEALDSSKQTFAIGKKVESHDLERFKKLFSDQAERMPNKASYIYIWNQFFDDLVKSRPIWFTDEIEEIVQDMKKNQKKIEEQHIFSGAQMDYNRIVSDYFKHLIKNYKTEYIHPKRSYEYECRILPPNVGMQPQSITIANRLFHLKNQIRESKDHEKYRKIEESFNAISDYRFDIIINKDIIRLNFKKDGEDWIEGVDCGLGLADLLLMVTISVDSDASFIFIEEPENHLHPEIQKRFLLFIKGIRSKQFILSTHSSVFLDPFLVDRIFYVYYEGEVKVTDETSKSEILNLLGYSVADNLVADMVILTEGPFDIPILQTIFKKMGIDDKYNIKFWPLCGDVMTHLDLSVIAERKNVMALIDSDPNSSKSRNRFTKKCKESGIYCKKLERYSIENYLTLDAIRKIFDNIPEDLIELKPNEKIDDQIGFAKKGKSIKSKNREIIEQMTLEDIESTDLFKFCEKIKKNLDKIANAKER